MGVLAKHKRHEPEKPVSVFQKEGGWVTLPWLYFYPRYWHRGLLSLSVSMVRSGLVVWPW